MNKRLKFITYGAVLLAIAAVFPMFKFPQYITGSVVNFVLLIAVYVLDVWDGVVIGCVTPWIALMTGQMPFAYMPPFIMIGNAIYVLAFGILTFGILKRFKNVGMIAGIVIGAVLKWSFLSFAVRHLVKAPAPLVLMMSYPQLITALIGGAIAFIVMNTKLLPKEVLK
jgi:hypothetical protein